MLWATTELFARHKLFRHHDIYHDHHFFFFLILAKWAREDVHKN